MNSIQHKINDFSNLAHQCAQLPKDPPAIKSVAQVFQHVPVFKGPGHISKKTNFYADFLDLTKLEFSFLKCSALKALTQCKNSISLFIANDLKNNKGFNSLLSIYAEKASNSEDPVTFFEVLKFNNQLNRIMLKLDQASEKERREVYEEANQLAKTFKKHPDPVIADFARVMGCFFGYHLKNYVSSIADYHGELMSNYESFNTIPASQGRKQEIAPLYMTNRLLEAEECKNALLALKIGKQTNQTLKCLNLDEKVKLYERFDARYFTRQRLIYSKAHPTYVELSPADNSFPPLKFIEETKTVEKEFKKVLASIKAYQELHQKLDLLVRDRDSNNLPPQQVIEIEEPAIQARDGVSFPLVESKIVTEESVDLAITVETEEEKAPEQPTASVTSESGKSQPNSSSTVSSISIQPNHQEERLKYRYRVQRWLRNPTIDEVRTFGDRDDQPYQHLSDNEIRKQRFFHGFTSSVDTLLNSNFNKRYSFSTARGKAMLAQMDLPTGPVRGIIYYGIEKGADGAICYHRMFKPITAADFAQRCHQLFTTEAVNQDIEEDLKEGISKDDVPPQSAFAIDSNDIAHFNDVANDTQIHIFPLEFLNIK